MPNFKLVRLPNNDLILSVGSKVPVANSLVVSAAHHPDAPAAVHPADIADLLLHAGSGVIVEAA